MFIQYTGEVLRGDKVEIYTWKDAKEPRTLHFYMFKNGDRVVNAKLQYFDIDPAAKAAKL